MRGEQLALLSSARNCFSRKLWRKTSTFVFLMLLAGWAPLRASTPQFQKAVVLRVEKSQPTLPYRRRIADSPPPPNEYDFVVSLRMGCVVYIGLYQSAIDYLPSCNCARSVGGCQCGEACDAREISWRQRDHLRNHPALPRIAGFLQFRSLMDG